MQTKSKLVSVIIPAYNASSTIIKTLDSAYNQTYRNFEIIVVNDGSTDNTLEIIKAYKEANRHENLKIIDKRNGGVSSARNLGVRNANGQYIALLDSDDIWLPEKLDTQMAILMNFPNISFIGTLHNNMALGFPYKATGGLISVSFRQLMIKMAPLTTTAVLKKEVFDKVGYYDEKQRYAEDGNLWLRISKHFRMAIINENFAIAGDMKPLFGHSGLSGNLKGMHEGELKNISEMRDLGYISFGEMLLYKLYSNIKYFRRCIITKYLR